MPRPEALSRRKALSAAAVIALSVALGGASVPVQAASVAILSAASPDATLIAHANRLAVLAHRCDAALYHRIGVEDRVFRLCPRPDQPPKPDAFAGMDINDSMPGQRVIALTKSSTYDHDLAAWKSATAAAQAAHEQHSADMEAQLGLHAIVRRTERMERRRDRWAVDLSMMRPATAAGLAAKTNAVLALLGNDRASMDAEIAHRADLVLSVLEDTVRLGAGSRA